MEVTTADLITIISIIGGILGAAILFGFRMLVKSLMQSVNTARDQMLATSTMWQEELTEQNRRIENIEETNTAILLTIKGHSVKLDMEQEDSEVFERGFVPRSRGTANA